MAFTLNPQTNCIRHGTPLALDRFSSAATRLAMRTSYTGKRGLFSDWIVIHLIVPSGCLLNTNSDQNYPDPLLPGAKKFLALGVEG